eukprot:gene198-262_t
MTATNRGICYMFFATVCFALIGAIAKLLAPLPPAEASFFASLIVLTINGSFMLRNPKVTLLGRHRTLLWMRGISTGIGTALFFISVSLLPLSVANVIQNTAPIFTAVLAIFILQARVKLINWLLFIIAFVGIGVMYKAQASISQHYPIYALLLGLFSAFFMGLSNNFNAKMKAGTEHPLVILNYSAFCTMVVTGTIVLCTPYAPLTLYDMMLLLAMGSLIFTAQYFAIKAFQHAPISKISVISYLGIPFSLLIDLLLGKSFTGLSLLGMGIVIVSVLLNTLSKEQDT